MAKTKPATTKVGEFEFDTGLAVPPATRNSSSSKDMMMLAAMPVGASFLRTVAEAAENIKDTAEREKTWTENAQKERNRWSGRTRRFNEARAKQGEPQMQFSIRIVNDETLGRGVRVYRIEDVNAD